ncbi:squalene--hopene cyclase [Falsibacillus albus]|uniref:Squalene--hopene cyclase n=1 Tax=Falsibacillus albus TaxID=2478915 RepID=A0A3L7JXN0_9BACI|nr:squalene--hopene cyclase [Falsibacillus albus]RLQ95503.1 squalene--hopene cyclase [Falsibacillus albus]
MTNGIIQDEIERIVQQLKLDQLPNGSWDYPFETGVITDAYMIILLRSLEWNDEELIRSLVARIKSLQEGNGAWKLFHDEPEGSLSLTIDAYYGLLFSGYSKINEPHMIKAQKFIIKHGGLKEAKLYTKLLLAMTGQYKWPSFFPLPPEFMLLPKSFPINFYDISVFGRANLAPLIILASNKYHHDQSGPSLSHLYITRSGQDDWEEYRSKDWNTFFASIQRGIKSLVGVPARLKTMGIEKAKNYTLDRIETDGTMLNYFSSTFYMVFALLSLGYPRDHAIIQAAVDGLKSMACTIDGHVHIQYTTANVWNTALISHALFKAGEPEESQTLMNSVHYLLTQQHNKYGDWMYHNDKAKPGGWGFSHDNTINPDVDDTTASLKSTIPYIPLDPYCMEVWQNGIQWVISMQNPDGGWPAFERELNNPILHLIPMEGAEFILLDPSTPDLTGRTLEFLGNHTHSIKPRKKLQRGIDWLIDNQEKDGSWYGRWGICYIYGTWAAVIGMIAAGISPLHPSVQKAVQWLKDIQNDDGGWGESCLSDTRKTYVPLNESTLTHTSWALETLIAASDEPTKEIEEGIHFLIREGRRNNWTTAYPKGQGMASFFYIHYHSYRHVFPLMTLLSYKENFGEI